MVLPVDLRQFVDDEVAAGRFNSDEEVMATALRLLQSRTHWQLRQDVIEGLDDVRAGRVHHIEDAAEGQAFFDALIAECEAERRDGP